VTLLDVYRAARRRWVVLRVSLRMSSNPTRLDPAECDAFGQALLARWRWSKNSKNGS
jgi:hypothetical protein